MIAGLLYSVLLALFLGIQLYLWWIWKKEDSQPDMPYDGIFPDVTLLIPVRNDEANISRCLRSVVDQKYPASNLQVIVVNDHSHDNTAAIVREYKDVELLELPEGSEGKKMGIQYGMQRARGEVIMTLDGDCEVGEDWVRSMVWGMGPNSLALTTGPVWMIPERSSFIEKYQEWEQAALNVLTYSGLKTGLIISASGANLAYPKSLFTEQNPYRDNIHIPSGDDVFLVHNVHSKGGEVRYTRRHEAIVYTNPEVSFPRFISQRIRWAGKSSGYSHLLTRLYLTLFAVVNVSFVILIIGGLWYPVLYSFLLGGFLAKFLTDYLIIHTGMQWGQRSICWQDALKASLFQVFYVHYVAGMMILGRDNQWKGR